MIVLGESERIETIAVGDGVAWKVEPNTRGNMIFLKAVAPVGASQATLETPSKHARPR